MRILVVEDDTNLNRQIKDALTEGGYAVDVAFDGEEGHFLGETEPYDAVILDIGLPQMDGLSVLEEWRRAGKSMPVLLLTARDRWSDKVQGIDAVPTTMWPSPSIWKNCWLGFVRWSAARPGMPPTRSPQVPCGSTSRPARSPSTARPSSSRATNSGS
jgi:CheY-like chemotaxis protein